MRRRRHRPVVVGEQVDREAASRRRGSFSRAAHRVDQRLRQLLAGRVAVRVQDAREAVPAFAREREVVRVAACLSKLMPQREQLEHALRALLDGDPHGLVVAQPRPADLRVADVRLDRIERLEHRRDAALGVPGVGLVDRVLGQQQDFAPTPTPRSPPASPATPPPMTSTSVNCCGRREALNGMR